MLLPDPQHLETPFTALAGGYLLLLSVSLLVIFLAWDTFSDSITISPYGNLVLEAGFLSLMFWLAEPILAFTVYYCAGHSTREMLEIMEESYSGTFQHRLGQFLLEAFPIVVATVVVGIIASFLLIKTELTVKPILALLVFVGLSVVLIPHMLFDVLHDRID